LITLEKILELYNTPCSEIAKYDAERAEDGEYSDPDSDMYSRCGGNVDDAYSMGTYAGYSEGSYDTKVRIRDSLKLILGV
jgi:hypothetical protein